VTVVSRHLAAAGAVWVDGPAAGNWIAHRLGPFGPTVGHAVPLGYPAYAVVPIPWDGHAEDTNEAMVTLQALLDRLKPYTAEQPIHSAIWDGFPIWHPTGTDPRDHVHLVPFWAEGERPSDEQLARERVLVTERAAADLVEEPETRALELPNRRYRVWSGPLRSPLALRHQGHPPSLIWPQDRSWFLGAPIYTNEFALGGSEEFINATIATDRLDARRATPDDVLHGDD
jgi:hypothetical protein